MKDTNEGTRKIVSECHNNEDDQGYLAECGHEEHTVERCDIGGCQGFIVNWRIWQDLKFPSNTMFICEMCQDAGYFDHPTKGLIQPGDGQSIDD